MREDFDRPCYVVSSNGFRDSVSYEDGWCYGPSRFLGTAVEESEIKTLIHADIRAKFEERNGLPLYFVSDHGNISRRRSVRLRRR